MQFIPWYTMDRVAEFFMEGFDDVIGLSELF